MEALDLDIDTYYHMTSMYKTYISNYSSQPEISQKSYSHVCQFLDRHVVHNFLIVVVIETYYEICFTIVAWGCIGRLLSGSILWP